MSENPFENPSPHDMGLEFPRGEQGPAELFVDGREFIGTFGDSKENKIAAEKMAETYGGVVENFGVEIESVDPKNNRVTKWERGDGFSVWR